MHEKCMSRNDDIFDQFRRRPAMYTGENTLCSIQKFLGGYHFALTQYKIPAADDPLHLPLEFHDWVAYRLHFYESTSGWCRMICDRTESDQQAIDRFFQLLSEFRERRPRTVAKLIGYRKMYQQFSMSRDASGELVKTNVVTRDYPESISLVTYTEDPGFFAYSDTENSFPFEGFQPDLGAFETHTGADRTMLTIIDKSWDPQPHPGA